MKKKLVQILMLLVATVSIGAFVSCKDTNEDLYTDLREAVGDVGLNGNLADRIKKLESDLETYKCACGDLSNPNSLGSRVQIIENIIKGMTGGSGSGSDLSIPGDIITIGGGTSGQGKSLDELLGGNNLIDLLEGQESLASLLDMILKELYPDGDKEQISNIKTLFATLAATDAELGEAQEKIAELETALAAIKQCECEGKFTEVYERLSALEGDMVIVKAQVQTALDNAAKALEGVEEVRALANAAQAAADKAQAAADKAQATADQAASDAAAAKEAADKAQATADAAKQLAEGLKGLADQVEANKKQIEDNKKAIDELKTTITTMSSDVAKALEDAAAANAQAAYNKTVIDTLKADNAKNQEAIESLNTLVNTLENNVTNLTTLVNNLQTQVGDNTTQITNITNSLSTLTSTVGDLTDRVKAAEDGLKTQGEKLTELEARIAAIEGATAISLEQVREIAKEEAAAVQAALQTKIDELVEKLKDYYTKEEIDNLLKDIKVTIEGNTLKIEGLDGRVGNLETRLDGVDEAIKALNEKIAEIKSCTCDKEATEKAIQEILDRLTTAEGNIDTVKEDLTKLINEKIDALKEQIDGLNYATPEDLNNLDEALKALIEAEEAARESKDDDLQKQINEIKGDVAGALADIVTMKADIEALKSDKLDKSEFNEFKESILDRVSTNETNIKDLQTAVTTISDQIDAIKEDVEDLKERMATAEENLNAAMQDIMALKSDVSAIQDYLAAQVTSLEIDGTNNPWFGTFSLPADIQSNVLVALYGRPKTDIEFPTMKSGNYVRPEEALTEADMNMINGVEVFEYPANIPLMLENNYAGKIYMTINPNTTDLTGLQPTIVNSKDEESLITLTPVKKSTALLQFGYSGPLPQTRADNAFYEAIASVSPADVRRVNAPTFEYSAMADAIRATRDALKDLANSTSPTAKIERIASDVNTIMKGMKFDRSGLKVSYPTKDPKTGEEVTQSVYSKYNLAATAFRPLNLETAKDFNYQELPGYRRVNSLLDRISNKVHQEVHVFFKDMNNSRLVEKIADLKINDIQVADLSPELLAKFVISIDEEFVIDGLSYHLQMPINENVVVKFDKNLSIPVHLEDVTVNVPVDIEEDVAVDLSSVNVTVPTVVVTGKATGSANAGAEIDPETGLPVVDPSTGEYVLVTELAVPVKDEYGNTVGTAVINLDDIKVNADINASGSANNGQPITLDGTPVGHVSIHKTVTGEVDIDDVINYHLELEETVPVTFNIDKWFYFGDNGTDKKTFHFTKTIDMSGAVEELWGNAQSAIGNVNTMLGQLRDIVEEVNNLLQKVNSYEDKITGTVDNYIDKIRSYIDKINSKGVALINSLNSRFQPFMIVSTPKGLKRLSGSKSYPTVLSGDIYLHPVSQTMELFVPFARKHVAVTNVFKGEASAQGGDSDCKAKLQAVNGNGNFNKVLDGTVRQVKMSGLEKGYVYEVAYSALDFEGKMATRKYYITIAQ